MTRRAGLAWWGAVFFVGGCAGTPTGDEDTDVADTDVAETDGPTETDVADTDAAETDVVETDVAETDGPEETDVAETDVAETDGSEETDDTVTQQPGDALSNPRLGPLRYVPSGSFTMGCVAGRDDVAGRCFSDESPARTVTLTKAFWMMESELTQGMWTTGLGFTNPSEFTTDGTNRPVERVNWWEALEAANEASRRDGLAACYTLTGCNSNAVGAVRQCTAVMVTSTSGHPKDCEGWRLPTEAEWEYAARAGTEFPYAGGSDVEQVAWYGENSDAGTKPVCTTPTPRNAWGLCDLSGNVREWVWDRRGTYTGAANIDPVGPGSGSYRVLRGGSWFYDDDIVRVSRRGGAFPGPVSYNWGFRLVRSVR